MKRTDIANMEIESDEFFDFKTTVGDSSKYIIAHLCYHRDWNDYFLIDEDQKYFCCSDEFGTCDGKWESIRD